MYLLGERIYIKKYIVLLINIIFFHNFISASFLWNPKYVPHSWMLMNYLPLFWQDSYLEKRILPLNSIHQDTYFERKTCIWYLFITYPKMKQFSFSMNMNASSFWKKRSYSFLFCNKIGCYFFFQTLHYNNTILVSGFILKTFTYLISSGMERDGIEPR